MPQEDALKTFEGMEGGCRTSIENLKTPSVEVVDK